MTDRGTERKLWFDSVPYTQRIYDMYIVMTRYLNILIYIGTKSKNSVCKKSACSPGKVAKTDLARPPALVCQVKSVSQSVWECFDDLGLDKNCNDTALKCVSLTRLRHSIRLELRLLSSGSWAASPSSPQKNSRYQPVQKKKSGAERAPTTELRLGEDWRKKGSPLCGNAGLKSCDLRFFLWMILMWYFQASV